jgi:peptide/nickel transport system permease protein
MLAHEGPRLRRFLGHVPWRYVSSRLLTTLLTIVGAIVLLFCLTLLVRGNPAEVLLGPRASPEAVADFARRMGVDLPVHERLLRFFGQVLRADLGTDFITGRPILHMVMEVLPFTVTLAFSAIGLALLVGLPLGCYAATHPGTWLDQCLAVVSVSFIAMPSFVVAVYLLLIFSIWLDWFPVLGVGSETGVRDHLARLVLPAVSLALGWVGYLSRLIRSSLLEVLGEPYIRTSRAYGLEARLILYKYALKNACLPTLAVLGLGLGSLLGGALVVEIVFARPGVGKLMFDAISTRNFPIVQSGALVVTVLYLGTTLIVDLSYAWLDPRIRDVLKAGGPDR